MSNDWIEHNGGPQPVGDGVWVTLDHGGLTGGCAVAWVPSMVNWKRVTTYRILNQHLIDAALERGIRMGLEAAMKIVWKDARWMGSDGPRIGEKLWLTLRNLNPDIIAREAVLDQLTSEAQADNMGYDND